MLSQFWFLFVVPGIPFGALLLWVHRTVKKWDRQSRRPFDDMPRPAGFSLQKRTEELWDKMSDNLMLCLITGVAAWALLLSGTLPLWIPLGVGFATCSFWALRAQRLVSSHANHRLGLLGEQVVGQILDRICSEEFNVFHDLEIIEPGRKPWNIDHVVLTPAGVFAIETKTRRKPKVPQSSGQQGHKVAFDGQQLLFPGFFKGRPPVFAQSQMAAIKAQLEERSRIDLTR